MTIAFDHPELFTTVGGSVSFNLYLMERYAQSKFNKKNKRESHFKVFITHQMREAVKKAIGNP